MLAAGSRSNSRFRWVPAAAGWIVGVIATLSLLASMSPLIRWLIQVPREFINDYLFNFPDTSFAWSFVLALLAAALTARKRIAWLLLLGNMILAAVLNAADIAAGGNTAGRELRREPRVRLPHRRDRPAGAELSGVLGQGPQSRACSRRPRCWSPGGLIGILVSWGLVEMFPGTLEPAVPAAVRGQPGDRIRHRRSRRVRRQAARSCSTRSWACSARWR